MKDYSIIQQSLNPQTAKNLSHITKSLPMMESITPRWFLNLLPWVPVEAGVYRVNRIKKNTSDNDPSYKEKKIELCLSHLDEHDLPQTFPDYEERPSEYLLSLIQTVLRVNTNITDIFNIPINQLEEQMRLTIEAMKERQEWEIINNNEFGLVNCVSPSMKIQPKKGSPTPDDMDELISKVWKKPAFFLAHPKAIAAFGRECTKRGVPPATVNLYGSPFITWRGIPLVPCDKLMINNHNNCDTTDILLMRVGEKEQGVIGLHQPGVPDETTTPSLSVKYCGIDSRGVSSYVLSLYFSTAVLADDAIGMLQNVEVGNYYD